MAVSDTSIAEDLLDKGLAKRSLVLLCAVIGLASFTRLYNQIFFYECAFIAWYVVVHRQVMLQGLKEKANLWVVAGLILWLLSMTYSMLASPYPLMAENFAITRYANCVAHVLFFFVVKDFAERYPRHLCWLLFAVVISTLLLALTMGGALIGADGSSKAVSDEWFLDPPFHSHIRHTSYQAAAALSAILMFLLWRKETPGPSWLPFVAATILWTFIFWLGGRGSVIGVVAALLLCFVFIGLTRKLILKGALLISGSMVAGLLLSEMLSVFPWNGILTHIDRTVTAGNANDASSGRLDLWLSVWESVQGHLLFGLGPVSYSYMPNHILGVQPHSVIFQFLVEWGIIGSLFFTALLVYAFWIGLRAVWLATKQDPLPSATAWGAGLIILALSAQSLVDGTYFHPQPSFYLALSFGIWTSMASRKDHKSA